MEAPGMNDEEDIKNLVEQLTQLKLSVPTDKIAAADFEKDDDSNYHIAFITASSNLRARNYKIGEADFHKTKLIAGKIIPAIATTTAMITGTVTNEIFKFVQGFEKLEQFKNAFINLAVSLFLFSEPDEVKRTKSKEYDPIMCGPIRAIPEGYTIFDKVVINKGPLTFQAFIDHFKTTMNLDVSMITCGNVALFNAYMPGNKHGPRLPTSIEKTYEEIANEPVARNYLVLEIGGSDAGGVDF
jgi:ubiquitin-activating enzyme E1